MKNFELRLHWIMGKMGVTKVFRRERQEEVTDGQRRR